VATGQSALQFGELFDSISVCLNKGMGCPIGSILLGSGEFIKKARRVRKVFGGGMRQAGFMAAAGLYALDHHIERLREDHDHAKCIAQSLASRDFIGTILPVETNIIIFEVKGKYGAHSFVEKLKEHNIYCIAISADQVRMVTHLDISGTMTDKLVSVIGAL
jgi:threonine aldolase